jgi:O-antigen ligase
MQHESVVRRRKRKERAAPAGLDRLGMAVDYLQGGLILAMIVGAPWMFGCTLPSSIQLMNCGAFALALLALAQRFLAPSSPISTSPFEKWSRRAFLACNLLLLAFCAIAVLNARAQFSPEQHAFIYREGVISWLPTTYDTTRTRQFLLNALAFFCAFWAIRAWIARGAQLSSAPTEERINPRLNFILWVFVVNGFLVALQGLLQRLSGSARLLWFRPSFWPDPLANFGPFSYRGNAVDYLNLVWPVTFGFWYFLVHRRNRALRGFGDGPELLLLPMFLITFGSTFATLSRGGILVAVVLATALVAWFFLSRRTPRSWKVAMAISMVLLVAFVSATFGDALSARFRTALTDKLSGRTEIYENARQMALDFPWYGTGPGTFLSVYYMYRESPQQTWAAFLHDDWMETRVTFGRIGLALVLAQFGLLALWCYALRPRWLSPVLMYCIVLSLLGCLLHAKVDFPFQTYGIVFTFLIVSVLLISCTNVHRPDLKTEN